MRLGSNDYYVLGDNRGCSADSRSYGPVPRKDILGLIAKSE
ncbi:MAG TPA: S26 family signal peptidase [Verrucomicrobiae bacterium]|nr:S26 family signal peptidase [Verrucomicrobiae bacterium]